MDYRDNPVRPRLHAWFGPMTMLDFITNMNMGRWWMPGTGHDDPMWQCKAGIVAALNDIQQNHPNDLISLISFSKPTGYSPSTGSTLQIGNYNAVRAPLSRNYGLMKNALYFAPAVAAQWSGMTGPGIPPGATEITPYDPNMNDVPRAIGGTCYSMGFMLAFNQFSQGSANGTPLVSWAKGNPAGTALPGMAGGLGRTGAQKLVIFETDGVVSSTSYQPGNMASVYVDQGAYNSWYKVLYDYSGASYNMYPPYVAAATVGGNEPFQETIDVVTQMCASDQLASGAGYSSRRKPVRIHTLAFGSLFETYGNPTDAAIAIANLQQIQTIGGTQTSFPIAQQPGNPKVIISNGVTDTNPAATRISLMTTAFSQIMNDGYACTLIN
jgi:hypothetical protein